MFEGHSILSLISGLSVCDKIKDAYIAKMKELQARLKVIDFNEISAKKKLFFSIEFALFSRIYWLDPVNLLKPGFTLTAAERGTWEGLRLAQFRQAFAMVFDTLMSLPEPMISNCEALLLPNKKFTRKTFEHFSALMRNSKRIHLHFPIVTYATAYTGGIQQLFKFEACEQEKIIEAALETSIIPEVDSIIEFMRFLYGHYDFLNKKIKETEVRKNYNKFFSFPGVYALTKRVVDTNTLYDLTMLTMPLYKNKFFKKIAFSSATLVELMETPMDTWRSYRVDIEKLKKSSIQHIFAVLGALQKIGELLTGKNLQNKISALDENVDWSWFITIRDTLSHQNESDADIYYDNYHKVKALMSNPQLLFSIECEIILLHKTILNLIALRYQNTNAFIGDRKQSEAEYKQFWLQVLKEETLPVENVVVEVLNAVYLLDESQVATFKSGLKSDISSEDLQFVEDVLYGKVDFKGKERGDFLSRCFVSRHENKSLLKECTNLLNKVSEIKKKNLKKENARKKQEASEKNEKISAERKHHYQNNDELEKIRELSFLFRTPAKDKGIRGHEILLDASIYYLDELRKLITQIPGKILSSSHHKKIQAKLSKHKEFKYAFDYCSGQALSMLGAASEKIEAVGEGAYFKLNKEILRKLRNWTQHGHAPLDFFEETFETESSPTLIILNELRHNVSYMILADIIVSFLPDLKKIAKTLPKSNLSSPLMCLVPLAPSDSKTTKMHKKTIVTKPKQVGWNCFDVAINLSHDLGIRHPDPQQAAVMARKELVRYALTYSDNINYRKLVAPEIKHAAALTVAYMVRDEPDEATGISVEDLLPSGLLPLSMRTDEIKQLIIEYQNAHQCMIDPTAVCNDALGYPEGSRRSFEELENYFSYEANQLAHSDTYLTFKTATNNFFAPYEQALRHYCEREDIYRAYIQGYYGDVDECGAMEWFAFQRNFYGEQNTSMIDIAAIFLQKKIIIHESKGNIIYQTKLRFPQETHIQYNGFNHFMTYDAPSQSLSLLSILNSELLLWKRPLAEANSDNLPRASCSARRC